MNKPLILVTNDDGYDAPGVNALAEVASKFGDVYVVAPDKPQSGMGHAITINATLRTKEIKTDAPYKVFSTTGTPADCVKLAVKKVLPRTPDFVFSGINHGSNASINVIYSGTMSATIEACIEGIPAVGFSLCDFSIEADFTASKIYAEKIIQQVLENKLPTGVCLNVNFPKGPPETINGIKVCRQATAKYNENFDERKDPHGRTYFWLTGEFELLDKGHDTDEYALNNHFVSVVPIHYDLTAYETLKSLNNWKF